MLKEFNVADNKTVPNVPTPAFLKPPVPKMAWGEDKNEKTAHSSSSALTPDKFVCEVLIRRSQDEDCMVSLFQGFVLFSMLCFLICRAIPLNSQNTWIV